MTDKTTSLFAMIEDYKLELERQLGEQIEVREAANKRIAEIRAEIDDLPRRKVRRSKKTEKPSDE